MPQTMKSLAVIATVWFPYSHADVIVRRWLEPDPERDAPWGFSGTSTKIASLFLAQVPENDIGVGLCEKHGVPIFPTIKDALTLGTDTLAVDGVLLIGEHGDYPTNANWQKLYPRKEFFDEIVAVFDKSGRVVPVFCDKHFSWNGEWAKEMWNVVQEKQIPWLAGSSTTLVGFRHATLGKVTPPPQDTKIIEGVCTFNVGAEAYGFHSLEVAELVLEKRLGGETGVKNITALAGEEVFAAINEGRIPADLLDACLAAEGLTQAGLHENIQNAAIETEYCPANPTAFLIEHNDGVLVWHVCLQGHVANFSVAFRTENGIFAGTSNIGNYDTFFHNFAALNAQIEKLVLTGTCDVPPERTLLTTLTIERCCIALADVLQKKGN
jgi:hypothetical protein